MTSATSSQNVDLLAAHKRANLDCSVTGWLGLVRNLTLGFLRRAKGRGVYAGSLIGAGELDDSLAIGKEALFACIDARAGMWNLLEYPA